MRAPHRSTVHRDQADITDRCERHDMTLAPDAAEAIDSNDPNDPTEATDSTLPTDPILSTEPFEAILRNESSDHNDQREPGLRAGPAT